MSTLGPTVPPAKRRSPARSRNRAADVRLAALLAVALGAAAWSELRTSALQSRLFAAFAHDARFTVEPGPSASIRFPADGPFDERLGYSRIPGWLPRLAARSYVIDRQARASLWLTQLTDLGVFPIYREKTQTGLSILGCNGNPVGGFLFPQRAYPDFASIPPLVVRSLLFIEDRELLEERFVRRNPAVEWDRFGYALGRRFVDLIVPSGRSPGASTLATQIEKYRHSPGGRTDSALEKARQMASASVRAYLDGGDTQRARRQIVVDYLNSMPLAAPPGAGEVFGLGDGLWGWYGASFDEVNRWLRQTPGNPQELAAKAQAYRHVLSLLVAQRRPSDLLAPNAARLDALTDSHLRLLHRAGIIDGALLDATLAAAAAPSGRAQVTPAAAGGKAADAVRAELSELLGVARSYDLNRLDLTVATSIDPALQQEISRQLEALADPQRVRRLGLSGRQLLARGDPGGVVYSFILFERTARGNLLRVQADSAARPFDVNDGAKLDMGSTAKLRTLVTYLQTVAELHDRFGRLDRAALPWVRVSPHDALGRWALDYFAQSGRRDLPAMLDAALERHYSASPAEAFFTGGGVHRFRNFHPADNGRVVTVREAFAESINLPFIRLMRDIVEHRIYGTDASGWLPEAAGAQRAEYLARFADQEGQRFLRRFYAKYQGKDPAQALAALARTVRPVASRQAAAFLSVAPEASVAALREHLAHNLPAGVTYDAAKLYARLARQDFSLADRGALARIHPLELWLVAFLREQPDATLEAVLRASGEARQRAYDWLFRTRNARAQDRRIRSIREQDAFVAIHARWQQLGYPFATLVPSYATAIGSSADRPAALAELIGIIANDGVRMPAIRIEALDFAPTTPFQTHLVPATAAGERVLAPEVATAVRRALHSVVEHGTAQRLAGTVILADGSIAAYAGKTGTGDNRIKLFAPGGRLLSSRSASRTATFVFMLGERYFGTITAYVSGQDASSYEFTSALPVAMLKALTPSLAQHLGGVCLPAPGHEPGPPDGTLVRSQHSASAPRQIAAR